MKKAEDMEEGDEIMQEGKFYGARIALVPTDASAETLHSKPLSFKLSTLARYV